MSAECGDKCLKSNLSLLLTIVLCADFRLNPEPLLLTLTPTEQGLNDQLGRNQD
jgi:hypothetical protein